MGISGVILPSKEVLGCAKKAQPRQASLAPQLRVSWIPCWGQEGTVSWDQASTLWGFSFVYTGRRGHNICLSSSEHDLMKSLQWQGLVLTARGQVRVFDAPWLGLCPRAVCRLE